MSFIGIDLFAGAGGMSLGAVLAGIQVVLAVEADLNAARTYSYNHPATAIHLGDVRALTAADLRLISRKGHRTVVFGGSPCQGFSTSNQRTRNLNNPSNWLYIEFVRIVKIWKPDFLVFENVEGMKGTAKGLFFFDLLDRLSGLGYSLSHGVLDAAQFGVPQHRKRLFVIGAKKKSPPQLPLPSTRKVTVGEAIQDLPTLLNGASENWLPYMRPANSLYARQMRGSLRRSANHLVTSNAGHIIDRYRHIPQGGNWTNIPPNLLGTYRVLGPDLLDLHTGLYRRLREDEPSVVIGNYRKNMLIHPSADRGLSVREAARIQSFPDSYVFQGSIGFQQQQVGNAVPPLLAKAVFQAILAAS